MKLKSLAGLLCAGAIITGGIVGDINWSPNPDTSIISIGDEAHAKRSGGRSGGGSIGRSSGSRSSRSSSRRSSSSSRTYHSSSSSSSSSVSRPMTPLEFMLMLGVLGGVFSLVIVRAASNFLKDLRSYSSSQGASNLGSGANGVMEWEDDIITVSQVQVALLANDSISIQTQLTTVSLNADTSTTGGLTQLVQSAAVALLRSPESWAYAVGSSKTFPNREQAEAQFNYHSFDERSNFSEESLVNVNGQLVQLPDNPMPPLDADPGRFVVVTLIAATNNNQPLFDEVRSSEDLHKALMQFACVLSGYVVRVEVLWTPQDAPESLSYEEFLAEYPHLYPLA